MTTDDYPAPTFGELADPTQGVAYPSDDEIASMIDAKTPTAAVKPKPYYGCGEKVIKDLRRETNSLVSSFRGEASRLRGMKRAAEAADEFWDGSDEAWELELAERWERGLRRMGDVALSLMRLGDGVSVSRYADNADGDMHAFEGKVNWMTITEYFLRLLVPIADGATVAVSLSYSPEDSPDLSIIVRDFVVGGVRKGEWYIEDYERDNDVVLHGARACLDIIDRMVHGTPERPPGRLSRDYFGAIERNKQRQFPYGIRSKVDVSYTSPDGPYSDERCHISIVVQSAPGTDETFFSELHDVVRAAVWDVAGDELVACGWADSEDVHLLLSLGYDLGSTWNIFGVELDITPTAGPHGSYSQPSMTFMDASSRIATRLADRLIDDGLFLHRRQYVEMRQAVTTTDGWPVETGDDSNHTLYRFFNEHNKLLYVGITNNFFGRVGGHASDKAWYTEIAYSTFEHFTSRPDLQEAERHAIAAENPRYNVMRATPETPASPLGRFHSRARLGAAGFDE